MPRFDEIAEAAGDERVHQELMTSVLEAATGVHQRVGQAIDEVREIRTTLRDAADEHDVLIASAGTHPFSRWEHQEISEAPRYQRLVEGLQWVAKRVAIFGLHVHVGIDDADRAVQVATQLRNWLPELLALSANSPYWHGRDTGLASTRSQIFDTMPHSGLPPRLESFAEFEQLVERGTAAGFFPEYTHLWWDVRPHPKLGTIELRICDAQTRVENVAAIAALTQSLVATLAEQPGSRPAADPDRGEQVAGRPPRAPGRPVRPRAGPVEPGDRRRPRARRACRSGRRPAGLRAGAGRGRTAAGAGRRG